VSFEISPSPRVRCSPFYASTVADGVVSFTAYNHMLMPTSYGDPEGEYERLLNSVSMWDVSVERQVQISGPDASELVRILTPRNLDKLSIGMGWYVPLCDHRGVIINDPILLKLEANKYWYSIADSDVLLWARAIAAERGLQVDVCEPDVSPLAIQGPKALDVVAKLFGDEIRSLRRFQFKPYELDGIPLIVARSGWSHQGGFELYLCDGSQGNKLWSLVKSAGSEFGIGFGAPNTQERVESGLLSWGGDTDDHTNPFELGLGRYIDLDVADDVIGIEALRKIDRAGAKRLQRGLVFTDDAKVSATSLRYEVLLRGAPIGFASVVVWSPRLKKTIGLGLLNLEAKVGDEVTVVMSDNTTATAIVRDLPFL